MNQQVSLVQYRAALAGKRSAVALAFGEAGFYAVASILWEGYQPNEKLKCSDPKLAHLNQPFMTLYKENDERYVYFIDGFTPAAILIEVPADKNQPNAN